MPQTKFVLGKALKLGLAPIVVINKVDKPEQRADEVLNEVFDLFAALDADEHQLDFPVVYASAKQGWAVNEMGDERGDMTPLFELILRHVPAPVGDPGAPFAMLATTLEANPYLGRLLTGRIVGGTLRANQALKALSRTGETIEAGRATKILGFRGLERLPIEEAYAGDIVAIAGFNRATVADTLCDPAVEKPIAAQPIDPSTIAMTFGVNDSAYAGQEGTKVTSRQIWDRLKREAEGNVAIGVKESEEKEAFEVSGRGELQLAVLIETMRREGFELSISRPRVLFQEEGGQRLEPIEEVVIDVDEEHTGAVVEKLTARKGDLIEMRPAGAGKQRLVFHSPSRALIGYHGEFLTDTRGTGVMNRLFHGYAPYKGPDQPALYGRAHLQRAGRGRRLRALEPRSPRADVRRSRRQGLHRHDHRRAHPRQRLGGQPLEGQEALQRPRRRQGRRRRPHPADPDDAGEGDRLHRRRRTGRDHPRLHPPAQAPPRPERAQARVAPGGGGVSGDAMGGG